MPHIHVKMIEGRSEEQKKALAQALEKAMKDALGVDGKWISIAIDDYNGKEWQDVFKNDIENSSTLYKNPEYDPKILL